jgi:GT2 family glycosyltransferase
MKLSIIIVSWNTRDLLRQCLHSVEQAIEPYTVDGVETFVVDNGSQDGSVQMVQDEFPWVCLLENGENVGFACANNQAYRCCSGEYVLLLNPDTVMDSNAIKILIAFADVHPEAGIIGPRLLNPDGSLQTSCYPAPTLTREGWRLFHLDRIASYGSYAMHNWPLYKSRTVDNVQGACLLLRRQALTSVNVLDEDYFMYTEEFDLCHRVRQDGWRIYWVPQAQVVHYGGQSTRQVAREMFLQLYHSKVLYFRKHYGKRATQNYKLILSVASLPRLVLSPLALLQAADRRRYHLALAGSYVHLLRSLPRW